jgi:hypothetical protein
MMGRSPLPIQSAPVEPRNEPEAAQRLVVDIAVRRLVVIETAKAVRMQIGAKAQSSWECSIRRGPGNERLT